MATTSFTALRRNAGLVFSLLVFSLCLSGVAAGQSAAPPVTVSAPAGLTHPTGWGAIQQTAIDQNGDWLLVDYSNGGLYEFPWSGGAALILGAPAAGANAGALGQGNNPGILIDPANNLYLEANWNNCLIMFPWDAATQTWTGLTTMTPANPNTAICTNSGKNNQAAAWAQYGIGGYSQGYFQPWGMAVGNHNDLMIASQGGGPPYLMDLAVNGAWSDPTPNTVLSEPVSNISARPVSVAVDPEGNIFFVEDYGSSKALPGVLEVPVGTTGLPNDSSLVRVDPNLPAVTGVITDPQGNLYITDSQEGVWLVPNPSGTPQTSAATQISPVPATGEAAIDWTRNYLYIPTSQSQSNGQADVAKVSFQTAELGPITVGKTGSSVPVDFSFNTSVTPARFFIVEDGASTPDFALAGGTCTTYSPYAAGTSCAESVTMSPKTVGSISAKMLIQTASPIAKGGAGASASATTYSVTGNVLTVTAGNSFSAGELISFNVAKGDALFALNGLYFNVMSAGLSTTQFEITTSLIQAPPSTSTTPPQTSATVIGYDYVTVGSIGLHGTGVGANMQATPSIETAIGVGLKAPTQLTVDGQGNIYVADPGQGKVLMYPAGSGASSNPTTVGTGLTAPTGVAVDGGGNIFIADSSNGSVYEIPYMPTGLNSGYSQVTVISGLGANLNLAVDGLGNLYIADPINHRVIQMSNIGSASAIGAQSQTILTAGFNTPSYVAVDGSNNLYVADGSNLFELPAMPGNQLGAPVPLLNNLSNVTGIASDPSSAVYIAATGGSVRIPSVSGTLVPANEAMLASSVTSPFGIALDRLGNVYLADGTALNVHVVTFNGTLNFGSIALGEKPSLDATVTNEGNGPLTVTGYTSQDVVVDSIIDLYDYYAADGTCEADSPVAAGANCQVAVTLNPGAGEQGTLTGQIGFVGNIVNAPVVVDTTGVSASLAPTTTTMTVGSSAQVIGTPVSGSVTAQSGGGTPTGQVVITYTSFTVSQGLLSNGETGGIINPITVHVAATLNNGTFSFPSLAPVMAGSQAISVEYIGDRTYARSTASSTVTIAKSSILSMSFDDNPPPYLPFTLAQTGGITTPFANVQYWQYNWPVTVNTTVGIPTGIITFMDNSSTCPPGTSTTGQGAAICALTNLSGPACPQEDDLSAQTGVAFAPVINSGILPTGAGAQFGTYCLGPAQNLTYTPVISTHYITPEYSGDANFLAFTGTPELFQAVRSPAVTLTSAPGSLTVQPGSSATASLTLTSLLGYGWAGQNGLLANYTLPVSLSCDNLPPHSACSFYYPNPDPNVSTAVDIPCSGTTEQATDCSQGFATVTINTNISVGSTTSQNARTASIAFAAIFGVGMFGLFFRRRRFEKSGMGLMVLLMIVGGLLAGSITACNTTNFATTSEATTPGTYAVTISAQQVGSECIAQVSSNDDCYVGGVVSAGGFNGISVYGSNNQVSLPFYINVTVQ
jgi:hypothetical protein